MTVSAIPPLKDRIVRAVSRAFLHHGARHDELSYAAAVEAFRAAKERIEGRAKDDVEGISGYRWAERDAILCELELMITELTGGDDGTAGTEEAETAQAAQAPAEDRTVGAVSTDSQEVTPVSAPEPERMKFKTPERWAYACKLAVEAIGRTNQGADLSIEIVEALMTFGESCWTPPSVVPPAPEQKIVMQQRRLKPGTGCHEHTHYDGCGCTGRKLCCGCPPPVYEDIPASERTRS